MSTIEPGNSAIQIPPEAMPNGSGSAAILATGIGCATLGVLALAGDASAAIGKTLNFYNAVGTLSGVSTVAIIVWLVSWFVLDRLWSNRSVALTKVTSFAFGLLILGLLLTFPPFMDLLQGK